tara:strand:+ start:525 stop:866 length:342 start_codon:yes stop_codon:yes gene_type:complete
METNEDFKRGDAFQSQWESNYDDARDDCMTEVDNILMEVEHIVGDLDQRLDVQNCLILADAIEQIKKLRYFDYTAAVEGKYDVSDQTFSYDFGEYIVSVLQDRLSFELILGAK